MAKKTYLVTGFAVGYLLGARAGRQRYDQIKAAAGAFWGSNPVQSGIRQAQSLAKRAGSQASHFLGERAEKVVSRWLRTGASPGSAPSAAAKAAAEDSGQ